MLFLDLIQTVALKLWIRLIIHSLIVQAVLGGIVVLITVLSTGSHFLVLKMNMAISMVQKRLSAQLSFNRLILAI